MKTTRRAANAEMPAELIQSAGSGWRLHRHADYQRVYKSSRKQFSARIAYFVAQQTVPATAARVGITAGRVLGKAVERNRIKRRMRAAIAAHYALLPAGYDIVLHPKRSVLDAPWTELRGEMKRLFSLIAKSTAAKAVNPNPTNAKAEASAERAQ